MHVVERHRICLLGKEHEDVRNEAIVVRDHSH